MISKIMKNISIRYGSLRRQIYTLISIYLFFLPKFYIYHRKEKKYIKTDIEVLRLISIKPLLNTSQNKKERNKGCDQSEENEKKRRKTRRKKNKQT